MMKNGNSTDLLEKVKLTVDRRDNVWLQLYVCPEFRKTGKCSKEGNELCIYAHPDKENKNLLILNSGLNGEIVVCCFENVFRTCVWKNCKFYHPPDHLKNVVKTNGKNNLRLRNELKQSLGIETKPQLSCETAPGVGNIAGHVPYYVLPQYAVPYYKGFSPSVPYSGEQQQMVGKEGVPQFSNPQDDQLKNPPNNDSMSELVPPGESPSKKRSRTPEPALMNRTPPKRTPPPIQPVYDPFRRMFIQDVHGGSVLYPPQLDLFNISMVYQNHPQFLPSYPYTFNYQSGVDGTAGMNLGIEQYQIPTLTSNRNMM